MLVFRGDRQRPLPPFFCVYVFFSRQTYVHQDIFSVYIVRSFDTYLNAVSLTSLSLIELLVRYVLLRRRNVPSGIIKVPSNL